jgi:hypothetical protein
VRVTLSLTLFVALYLVSSQPARADDKPGEGLTDQEFGRLLSMFLDDPLHEKGKAVAKGLVVFTLQTPDAAVVLGEPEMKWVGKAGDRSTLLFAAYVAGNTRAQLLTGVKQNDRYSGLMALFAVYRRLQEKDAGFKIDEVETLRKLHREGKLLEHLAELEKKAPTKLTPEAEKSLKELLNLKK